MNKLLVNGNDYISDGIYNIINDNNIGNVTLHINGNVTLSLNNIKLDYIKLVLNNNAILKLYKYNDNCNDLKVDIYSKDNNYLEYNESIQNKKDTKIEINNYIEGNNSNSLINIRNVSYEGTSTIIVNTIVKKDTFENIATENLKGITNGGKVRIDPNIECFTNEVSANHLTTIGSINVDSLNYLMSKGISEKVAKETLLKGFIFSNMNEFIKKENGGE